jgi:hypothetical protein
VNKLKAAWKWFVESRAWLFVVGVLGALVGLFLLAGRRGGGERLERSYKVAKKRELIERGTSAEVEAIWRASDAAVDRERADTEKQLDRIHADLDRKAAEAAKDLEERYEKLNGDDDAARAHLRKLIDGGD